MKSSALRATARGTILRCAICVIRPAKESRPPYSCTGTLGRPIATPWIPDGSTLPATIGWPFRQALFLSRRWAFLGSRRSWSTLNGMVLGLVWSRRRLRPGHCRSIRDAGNSAATMTVCRSSVHAYRPALLAHLGPRSRGPRRRTATAIFGVLCRFLITGRSGMGLRRRTPIVTHAAQ